MIQNGDRRAPLTNERLDALKDALENFVALLSLTFLDVNIVSIHRIRVSIFEYMVLTRCRLLKSIELVFYSTSR